MSELKLPNENHILLEDKTTGFFGTSKPSWLTENGVGTISYVHDSTYGTYAKLETGTASVGDAAWLALDHNFYPGDCDLLVISQTIHTSDWGSTVRVESPNLYVSGNYVIVIANNATTDPYVISAGVGGVNTKYEIPQKDASGTDAYGNPKFIRHKLILDFKNNQGWFLAGGHRSVRITDVPTVDMDLRLGKIITQDTASNRILYLNQLGIKTYRTT